MHHVQRPPWFAFIAAAGLALLVLAVVAVAALAGPRRSLAQGNIELEISKELDNSSGVVRVGEILTFTIRITNQSPAITITELPLYDAFDAEILRFVGADPAPDSQTTSALTWTNLIDQVGLLAPGQSVEVTTYFQAIRPREATVNFARIGTAQGVGGETGGGDEDEAPGPPAEGGKLPVTKLLETEGTIRVGQLITFSLGILNDGAATIDTLPFEDEYNAAALLFVSSDPAPDMITVVSPTGRLSWQNLGPLAPGEIVTITTVYSTLAVFAGDVNSAAVVAARDEFGNQIAEAEPARVPIRIIADEAATPSASATPSATPTATSERSGPADDDDDDDDDQPTSQATGEAAAQPTANATLETQPTPTAGLETTPAASPTAAAATATSVAEVTAGTTVVATATASPTASLPAGLPNTGTSAPTTDFLLLSLLATMFLLLGYRLRRTTQATITIQAQRAQADSSGKTPEADCKL